MFEKKALYPNMMKYARDNLRTFDEDPINEVDCLIFAWLVFLNIVEDEQISATKEGIPIKELLKAEHFETMFDKTWSKEETFDLLVACASSPRFRDVNIKLFRNDVISELNLQFAATVFSIREDLHVVAFRGTDWSITGWKEDALLALDKPIPSHYLAATYLDEVAKILSGKLITCGHSKGGNMAVFAAANCEEEVQDRILQVCSFDGPGFRKSEIEKPGLQRIKERITKFIPQESYFGMLFDTAGEIQVIHSKERGIVQHNPMSWRVVDDQMLARTNKTQRSYNINLRINHWIDELNDEEIRILIQAVFDVIDQLEVDNIEEIMDNPKVYLSKFIRAIKSLDGDRQKFLRYALFLMIDRGNHFHGDEGVEKPVFEDELPTEKYEADLDENAIEKAFHLFMKREEQKRAYWANKNEEDAL